MANFQRPDFDVPLVAANFQISGLAVNRIIGGFYGY